MELKGCYKSNEQILKKVCGPYSCFCTQYVKESQQRLQSRSIVLQPGSIQQQNVTSDVHANYSTAAFHIVVSVDIIACKTL